MTSTKQMQFALLCMYKNFASITTNTCIWKTNEYAPCLKWNNVSCLWVILNTSTVYRCQHQSVMATLKLSPTDNTKAYNDDDNADILEITIPKVFICFEKQTW